MIKREPKNGKCTRTTRFPPNHRQIEKKTLQSLKAAKAQNADKRGKGFGRRGERREEREGEIE